MARAEALCLAFDTMQEQTDRTTRLPRPCLTGIAAWMTESTATVAVWSSVLHYADAHRLLAD